MVFEELAPLAKPSTRSDQVCESLRQAILAGAFKPGEQLHEGRIAKQLGVSKTPVREAISTLRATGFLEAVTPRGIVVATINAEKVRHVYEVRLLLEPAAVRDAVPLMDEAIVARIASLLATAKRAGEEHDLVRLSDLNREFHRSLYERCPNPLLQTTLESMRDQIRFMAANGWSAAPSWDLERQEHELILEAAAMGDAEKASRLTSDHIRSAEQRLLRLSSIEPPSPADAGGRPAPSRPA
jgi:DNA-binding GntR family transcriptional regulator